MANARCSYHAARMSLTKLFGDVRDETLFNRVHVAKNCYLWTFTTPDQCTAREVCNRWRKFYKKVAGLECFRVIERHPRGHGYHVHFITVKRYDVREFRKFAERSGFGRIHVVRIPTTKAHYVVKYLVKALRASRDGVRLWACVGYSGVRSSDVIIEDTFWAEVFDGSFSPLLSVGERRQRGLKRVLAALFKRDPNEVPKTMDNKHHAAVIDRINKGETICVAEYRNTRADKISFATKQNPSVKEERVILRHGLEMGTSQMTCVEWTPQGTQLETATHRLPFKKGQLVLVSVKKLVTEKGNTEISGELVPLS